MSWKRHNPHENTLYSSKNTNPDISVKNPKSSIKWPTASAVYVITENGYFYKRS